MLPEPDSGSTPLGEATHRLPPWHHFTCTRGINVFISSWARGPMQTMEGRQ